MEQERKGSPGWQWTDAQGKQPCEGWGTHVCLEPEDGPQEGLQEKPADVRLGTKWRITWRRALQVDSLRRHNNRCLENKQIDEASFKSKKNENLHKKGENGHNTLFGSAENNIYTVTLPQLWILRWGEEEGGGPGSELPPHLQQQEVNGECFTWSHQETSEKVCYLVMRRWASAAEESLNASETCRSSISENYVSH